ncbi:MAG TPA: hypothetical protein PKJ43_07760 [Prolixibacteraceae bacterium]|nr:hypothetical protein [Bacteroidales bacterium]MDI9516575.1 hypothetical protein [Bacteroidota bacterium]OQC61807.1 MAG: hypothetical protein BWX49_02041 [Bacteroidetes bacterium ADurb.Bin008]HNZ72501.1 hypothetical protein [Prolixibacteraceae bacterium]HPI69772.1 hypothetical protein [Tenuifilaceae bacterium]
MLRYFKLGMENRDEKTVKERQRMIVHSLMNDSDDKIITFLHGVKENYELFIIEPLLDLLMTERSLLLKKHIVEFISNAKEKDVVSILVKHLKKNFPHKNVGDMLTICWQSRLDFSGSLDVFFEILVDGDYQTSIEAFTVIESAMMNLNREEIEQRLDWLKISSHRVISNKQSLIHEMENLLDRTRSEML